MYQLCSSLDHALTVKTLPTQALSETMGIALKTTKCLSVYLEVLHLFDFFPSFMPLTGTQDNFSVFSL